MGILIRAFSGLLIGISAGLFLGFVEGGVVLHLHGLRFATPLKEAVKLGLNYGAMIGILVALTRIVLPKIQLRAACFVALALGLLLLGSHWLGKGSGLLEVGLLAWISSAAVSVLFTLGAWKLPKQTQTTVGVVLSLGALSLVFFAPTQSSEESEVSSVAAEGAPNVVVLLIDTLRADHLSCYGYQQPGNPSPISPVLDNLASQGTLFENTYAQAPWTRPSVASLMTGLFPTSHDTVTMYDRMPEGLETVATLLRKRGYQTAAFSANAQVSPNFGFNRGFDYFWTDVSYSLRSYCALNNLRRDLIHTLVATVPKLAAKLQGGSTGKEKKSRSSEARKLNSQVTTWLGEQDKAKPTFLYVQYIDPHDPYDAPAGWQPEGVPNIHEVMGGIDFGAEMDSPPRPLNGSIFPIPPADALANLLSHYDAEIRYCDTEIGKLVTYLEENGFLGPEDYLLITADHGEEFYDHQQWKHGHSLFQEMVQVPLIVRGPNVRHQRIETSVQLVDILPTISEWTGDSIASPVHGQSLVSLLNTGSNPEPTILFFERPKGAFPMQAIRKGDYKMIRIGSRDESTEPTWMLFDIGKDPNEQSPLNLKTPLAKNLMALLEEFRAKSIEQRMHVSRKTELSGDVAAALSSLGYMDGEEEEED